MNKKKAKAKRRKNVKLTEGAFKILILNALFEADNVIRLQNNDNALVSVSEAIELAEAWFEGKLRF